MRPEAPATATRRGKSEEEGDVAVTRLNLGKKRGAEKARDKSARRRAKPRYSSGG
jgi:hypothetical protein